MRTVAMILIFVSCVSAQTKPQVKAPVSRAAADQLGMTCAQILEISSTDWMAKFTAEKGTDAAATVRGIEVYGKCYDARTDQLAASLGKSGKGPLMGANGNFQSIEQALKAFTAKALAESQPPADAVKSAYAALYEKQFRYEFYQSYEPQPAPLPAAPVPAAIGAVGATATPSLPAAPVANADFGANAAAPAPDAKKPAAPTGSKSADDPMTQAKNHFGDLLGNLPDDQMHDLHGSFGEILGPNDASSQMRLLIYRYAIFLLEPPGQQPFSPPPF
jgi:hypothetical protein